MLVMCPPFNLSRTVIRPSGRRHAELFRVMQTSALPTQHPNAALRICVNRGNLGYNRNTAATVDSDRPDCDRSNMLMLRLGKRIAHRSKQESEQ
jgi:hypothetical protein